MGFMMRKIKKSTVSFESVENPLLKISHETKGPPLQPHLAVLAVAHGAALNYKQSYLRFQMLFTCSAKNHVPCKTIVQPASNQNIVHTQRETN